MTPNQLKELKDFVPESEMVKSVFQNMHPDINIENWEETIEDLAKQALNGDINSLFTLLELTASNFYNEGMLDEAAAQEEFY